MKTVPVKIARIETRRSPAILSCVLGSCIGIVLYDSNYKIESLAHAMLSSVKHAIKKQKINPSKYVDTAIDIQLKEMNELGSKMKNIKAKLVGGASMFKKNIKGSIFNIGERNIEIAKDVLQEKNIKIIGKDLEKNFGRTLEFYLRTGKVRIYKAGGAFWKQI
ncbi:MAG: chemotaxis protein CheD [Candidatus Hodarchaeales archaeon]|jgi:chemotaxis protein CheD